MNEHQDTADQTGADAAAETPEAPKKRRAPRKTAAAAAAPVDVVTSDAAAATDAVAPVVKKPRAPRKAAVADAGTPAIPMLVDAQEPVTPAVRPSRSRKKDVPEALEAPAAETSSSVAVAVVVAAEPVVVQAPAAEAAAADSPAADEASAPRRRERDRQRRKERRGPREDSAGLPPAAASAGADAAGDEEFEVIVVSGGDDDEPADVGTLFAEVVSGDYDAEVAPDADDELVDSGKRVLRPEPEAPKLHKVLAQAGIGSRREMEQLIQDGQVSVNGEAAHIGMRIAQGDQIRIAGRPIKVRIAPPPARVLAYHKEVGEVVTHHDPEGRPTVFRRLPRLHTGKWFPNSSGCLLSNRSKVL